MLVSVIKTRRLPKAIATKEAIHGWVPGSSAKSEPSDHSKTPKR
jgi:tellurite resistance protein TerC